MAELSKMQQRIYDFLVSYIQSRGYPPSVREIGEAVGLKSPSTVHFHLKHLEEAGVIEKGAGKGRAITLTAPPVPEDKVPIVGNVAAGSPILAEECIEDYLTFDTGGRSGHCHFQWFHCFHGNRHPLLFSDEEHGRKPGLGRQPQYLGCITDIINRPRSNACPGKTGIPGCCRKTTPILPLTVPTPRSLGKWRPWCGDIE